MKVRDVIKKLKEAGWVEVRQESSHRTFKKDSVANNVVVNGHDGEDVSSGVLSKIRKDGVIAAMKVDVIVERAGQNWCAYAPDLQDVVVATGATRDETIERFREALRGLLDYKREEGRPLPDVTELEIRETVAA